MRNAQDAPGNVMVSLSKVKPTGCPANMRAIAKSRATASNCDQSGGYTELQLDVNEDLCTAERSRLCLWVQLKGASQVSHGSCRVATRWEKGTSLRTIHAAPACGL